MPTGYTYGVWDGEVTEFKDFAKTCMRAFGATIHMRDESLNKEYEPRVPSKYHSEALERCKDELLRLKELSLFEYKMDYIQNLMKRREECLRNIEENKERVSRTKNMLSKALDWDPPTKDHIKFKDFMVQQLNTTLKSDDMGGYYQNEVSLIDDKLKEIDTFDFESMLSETIEEKEKEIRRHEGEQKKKRWRGARNLTSGLVFS